MISSAMPKFCENIVLITSKICNLKGLCHEIFWLLFFSRISFPLPQSIPLRPFRIFSKIRGDIRNSRFATGVNNTGGKWKKSSIRKILIILFGHLWVVEETYIWIFEVHFQVPAAWYCSNYLPPVSMTPVANLPPVSFIPVAICHRRRWHRRRYRWHRWQHKGNWWQILPPVSRWCTLTCEYLREFSKKYIERILMLLSGAWGKVIHEKNLKQKISWHCPFKTNITLTLQFFR